MAAVGDVVRVLAPFTEVFPDQYAVEGFNEAGDALINGGCSFAAQFLEVVSAGSGATAPTPARRITRLAFRNRFSQAEKVAIELASLDDITAPQAQRQQAAGLRVYLQDLDAAQYIDLSYASTRSGVQGLEAAGLLSAGRALQILDNPILDSEAY